MPTIRIVHDQYAGQTFCPNKPHFSCFFIQVHDNEETDEHFVSCKIGCMVDGSPGPLCPGPGLYRLIDEERVKLIQDEIDGAYATKGNLTQMDYLRLVEQINAAGLGRKETK